MNQINVKHKCWPNFIRYIMFIINTIVYINDLWTVLLNSNICCCLKIGKRKKLFFSNKKSNVIVRLPKHKATTHVPLKKALLNASHIMSNSNERENEKKKTSFLRVKLRIFRGILWLMTNKTI